MCAVKEGKLWSATALRKERSEKAHLTDQWTSSEQTSASLLIHGIFVIPHTLANTL